MSWVTVQPEILADFGLIVNVSLSTSIRLPWAAI